jgi:hypothetical protein
VVTRHLLQRDPAEPQLPCACHPILEPHEATPVTQESVGRLLLREFPGDGRNFLDAFADPPQREIPLGQFGGGEQSHDAENRHQEAFGADRTDRRPEKDAAGHDNAGKYGNRLDGGPDYANDPPHLKVLCCGSPLRYTDDGPIANAIVNRLPTAFLTSNSG